MTDTPRRRTTRSTSRANTPQAAPALPALNTAPIHSYGSRGKVTLKHQVATAQTNLADVFQANQANDRDPPRRSRTTSAISEEEGPEESVGGTESEVPEEDEDGVLVGDRNATRLHSSAVYDPSIHGSRPNTRDGPNSMPPPPVINDHNSMLPPARPPVRSMPRSATSLPPRSIARSSAASSARPLSRVRSPRPVYDDDDEPVWLSVFLRAVPRYLWRNFWALILGALLLSTLVLMPLPRSIGSHRDRIVRASKTAWGVSGYDVPPEKLEQLFALLRYNQSRVDAGLPTVGADDYQWQVNEAVQQQIERLEQTRQRMELDMEDVKQYVPNRMAVDVLDSGETVIKEEFWQALSDKVAGSPEAFEAFMSANQHAVENHISRSASRHLSDQLIHHKIISRHEVLHLIESEHSTRMAELSSALSALRHDTLSSARSIASSVATSILETSLSTSQTQLSALARSIHLQNTLEALHTINYFSPGLGARIDPHHTSPTRQRGPPAGLRISPYMTLYLNALTLIGLGPVPDIPDPRPIHALTRWSEMGDCWCAPPSIAKSGAAQLAIYLPHAVIPTRLTLEHIPARGTQNIASAPRQWELWACFPNSLWAAEAAAFVAKELARSGRTGTAGTSCTTAVPPVKNAACIGQGTYDIHGDNWVQGGDVFADFAKLYPELGVTKVIFRVVQNWGADYTCLYRVRLGGKEIGAGKEE